MTSDIQPLSLSLENFRARIFNLVGASLISDQQINDRIADLRKAFIELSTVEQHGLVERLEIIAQLYQVYSRISYNSDSNEKLYHALVEIKGFGLISSINFLTNCLIASIIGILEVPAISVCCRLRSFLTRDHKTEIMKHYLKLIAEQVNLEDLRVKLLQLAASI